MSKKKTAAKVVAASAHTAVFGAVLLTAYQEIGMKRDPIDKGLFKKMIVVASASSAVLWFCTLG